MDLCQKALEDVVVREAKAEVDEAVVGAVVMALFESQKITLNTRGTTINRPWKNRILLT